MNTNGVISFLGNMSTYNPSPLPLGSRKQLIAPYWADIGEGGDIWYRESTNSTLLQMFSEKNKFEASWLFIATWDKVAFHGAKAKNPKVKENKDI